MIHLNLFALLLTAFYSIIVIGYQLWFLWDSRLKYRNFASFFESAMIEILVSPITFVWFLVNSYKSSEDGNKITYIYNPILITAIISLLLGFIFLCIHRDQLLQYKSYKYCVYISRFITGIPLLFSPFSSFLLFLFPNGKINFSSVLTETGLNFDIFLCMLYLYASMLTILDTAAIKLK